MKKEFKIFVAVLAVALLGAGCNKIVPSGIEKKLTQDESAKVVIIKIPEAIETGAPLNVEWSVAKIGDGEKAVHAAIHYDTKSHSGKLGTEVSPKESEYPNFTSDFAQGSYDLPQNFPVVIKDLPDGFAYLRAHAIVAGQNYWSEEKIVAVGEKAKEKLEKRSEQEQRKEVKQEIKKEWKEIEITAKQWAFDPARIIVHKGDNVRLKIKSLDVEHGFSLPDFNVSADLKSGQTQVVEFTPDKQGVFQFSCNVYCGQGHAEMKGNLVVE